MAYILHANGTESQVELSDEEWLNSETLNRLLGGETGVVRLIDSTALVHRIDTHCERINLIASTLVRDAAFYAHETKEWEVEGPIQGYSRTVVPPAEYAIFGDVLLCDVEELG